MIFTIRQRNAAIHFFHPMGFLQKTKRAISAEKKAGSEEPAQFNN